jgi:hypothetical protein
LNALAVRLRDDHVDVRNPALARDLDTAADVASEHASWRFAVAEVAASLRAGNFVRNELLELIGKPDLAAAEPAFFAIFYDTAEQWDAPGFLKLAHGRWLIVVILLWSVLRELKAIRELLSRDRQ